MNIAATPHGFQVVLIRQRIKFQAFISSRADGSFDAHVVRRQAFLKAMAMRDRFLAKAPQRFPRRIAKFEHARPVSNTGIAGISETVKWVDSRPVNCFCVYLGKQRKPQMKRVYYGDFRPREVALRKAIQLRKEVCCE